MRKLSLLAAITFLACPLYARQAAHGYCEQGGHTVTTQGLSSTNDVQESYASCTVTVYNAGTSTLSTIYSDNSGTVKGNPFTSDSDGWWSFYANNGRYDVHFSGSSITVPYTQDDYLLCDPDDANGSFSCTGGGGSTPACSTLTQGSLAITPQTCAGEKTLQGIAGNPTDTNFTLIPASDQTGWNFYSGVDPTNFVYGGGATDGGTALYQAFNDIASLNQLGWAGTETPSYDDALTVVNQDNTHTTGFGRAIDGWGVMTGGSVTAFHGIRGNCEQEAGAIADSCDGLVGTAVQYGGTATEVDSIDAGAVHALGTTTYGVGLTIESQTLCGAANCFAWYYPDRGSIATSSFMTPDGSIQIGNTGAAVTQNIRGLRMVPTTFNGLPACSSSNEGDLMPITDSTANTFGATITGGGSNHVLGYCDGTNWTVAAL